MVDGGCPDPPSSTRFPPTGLVVLDEAYREFVTDPAVVDGLSLLDRYQNLIVLRTFSKAYGLAGMRVGYGIAADPAVAMAVRQTQTPFAVTSNRPGRGAGQPGGRCREAALGSGRRTGPGAQPGSGPDYGRRATPYRNHRPTSCGWPRATARARSRRRSSRRRASNAGIIVRAFAGSGVRITIGSPSRERPVPGGSFGTESRLTEWAEPDPSAKPDRLPDCPPFTGSGGTGPPPSFRSSTPSPEPLVRPVAEPPTLATRVRTKEVSRPRPSRTGASPGLAPTVRRAARSAGDPTGRVGDVRTARPRTDSPGRWPHRWPGQPAQRPGFGYRPMGDGPGRFVGDQEQLRALRASSAGFAAHGAAG